MVAPSINEEYYQEAFSDIVDYDIQTINTIWKDNVILLVDTETKHLFEGKIPMMLYLRQMLQIFGYVEMELLTP